VQDGSDLGEASREESLALQDHRDPLSFHQAWVPDAA
jgi:hypothetical protein